MPTSGIRSVEVVQAVAPINQDGNKGYSIRCSSSSQLRKWARSPHLLVGAIEKLARSGIRNNMMKHGYPQSHSLGSTRDQGIPGGANLGIHC